MPSASMTRLLKPTIERSVCDGVAKTVPRQLVNVSALPPSALDQACALIQIGEYEDAMLTSQVGSLLRETSGGV